MTAYSYAPMHDLFDFDDVMLVPQECVIKSRSEADVSVSIGNFSWELPVVPANMSSVVDEDTCVWLAERGFFYVMHRFDVDIPAFVRSMGDRGLPVSISVGVKEADYALCTSLAESDLFPDYVTVDVAHGDSGTVVEMVKFLRRTFSHAFIIAGNVATDSGAVRLAEAGADAVKVGVGPGSACLTAPNTGFGTRGWHLSSVGMIAAEMERSSAILGRHVAVIADGGIRTTGDIAKALAFGADVVMVGGMFAGHDENPGEVVTDLSGRKVKSFYGSASAEQKGDVKHVEGKSMFLAYKGSLADTLQDVREQLQSSVSYSGGRDLSSLRNVPYVRV